MNKANLIAKMAEKSELTKKQAEAALNAFVDTVTEAMKEGDKVQLMGFGTFEVKVRAARQGRNPATKENIEIPEKKIPPEAMDDLRAAVDAKSGVDNAGKASLLIDRLMTRRDEGLTTPKQIRFLESRGFEHVGTWEFEQARRLIDRIAANGWRIPYDINPAAFRPEVSA